MAGVIFEMCLGLVRSEDCLTERKTGLCCVCVRILANKRASCVSPEDRAHIGLHRHGVVRRGAGAGPCACRSAFR